MSSPRRLALAVVLLLLAACGSSTHNATEVAGEPSSSGNPGFVTTAPPTPAPTAVPPTPTATPEPTPPPTPSPTPQATSAGIIPSSDNNGAVDLGYYLYPSSSGVACGGRSLHYDACPVTSRLAARLDQHPTGQAEPMCRCQNSWQKSSVSTTQTPDPTVWIDHVVITFGPAVTVTIDLRVMRTSGGWLGDDTTCTGKDETTSIYADTPPPCPGA